MAKFCSKCNRKIGFFAESFDGMCQNCYNKAIEQERIRREEEKKLEEIERQKEMEQKRLEEIERQKEMEQKRLEEQKQKEELERLEQEKEIKNKCEYIKKEVVKYPAVMEIFYTISRSCTSEIYNYEDSYAKVGIVLKNVLIELIKYLPENFTEKDIDSINKPEILIKVALEMNYMLNDDSRIEDFTTLKEKLITEDDDDDFELDEYVLDKYTAREYLYCAPEFIYDDVISEQIRNKSSSTVDIWLKTMESASKLRKKYGTAGDLDDLTRIRYQEHKILTVEVFFDYALVFLYNLNFCKNLDLFEENEELITMYNNLINVGSDMNYIADKLYYIYDKLYPKLFTRKLDNIDFFNLMKLKKVKDSTAKDEKDNEFANLVNKDMDLEQKQDLIIKRIEENEFLTLIKQDCSIDEQTKISIIVDEILNRITIIKNTITFNELLEILANVEQMSVEIYNNLDKIEAEKERKRLLKGDLASEKEIQKQELEYSFVQNGYEFEEYVAKLYKKLGYTIEEVTKKSGDQRC